MKKIDLSVQVSQTKWHELFGAEQLAAAGHIGTHFDVMNTTFDLENTKRPGKIVDVSGVRERDIGISDVRATEIRAHDFVIFHTGFLQAVGYGTPAYRTDYPQLARDLLRLLLEKQVSLIGLDAPGVRRGVEHTPTDQWCADHGVFIVENLANTGLLLQAAGQCQFTVYTFPLSIAELTGLPCRVIAEIELPE
jgi:kynurenine formamidase